MECAPLSVCLVGFLEVLTEDCSLNFFQASGVPWHAERPGYGRVKRAAKESEKSADNSQEFRGISHRIVYWKANVPKLETVPRRGPFYVWKLARRG
jgi:hypothetical protein